MDLLSNHAGRSAKYTLTKLRWKDECLFVGMYKLLITLERSIRNIDVHRQNVNFCVKFNGQQKNYINFFCILSEYLYAINFASLRMLVYLHYYINGCICVWRVQMHVVYETQFTFHRQISCVILQEHVKLISIKAQMNLFAQRFPVYVYGLNDLLVIYKAYTIGSWWSRWIWKAYRARKINTELLCIQKNGRDLHTSMECTMHWSLQWCSNLSKFK